MILNRQRAVRVACRPLELFLRRVSGRLGLEHADVTICLVSDAEMARINESFRNKSGPTDVLSFPAVERRRPVPIKLPSAPANRSAANFPAHPSAAKSSTRRKHASAKASRVFLGDIAISPETARRHAKEYRRALDSELRILILHGILHLLGYDHETDRGQMDRLERKLRRDLGLLT